jgi:hypothetical protein
VVAPRRVIALPSDAEQRQVLLEISRSRTEPASRVERARIILAYLQDPSTYAVARRIGVTQQTVGREPRSARAALAGCCRRSAGGPERMPHRSSENTALLPRRLIFGDPERSVSAAETSPTSIAGIAPSYGPKTVSAVPNAAAIVRRIWLPGLDLDFVTFSTRRRWKRACQGDKGAMGLPAAAVTRVGPRRSVGLPLSSTLAPPGPCRLDHQPKGGPSKLYARGHVVLSYLTVIDDDLSRRSRVSAGDINETQSVVALSRQPRDLRLQIAVRKVQETSFANRRARI